MFDNKYAGKLSLIGFFITGLFCLLIGRLVFLQIVEGDSYKRKADGNRLRITPIIATRGTFVDRNGKTLVTSRPGFVVSLSMIDKNRLDKPGIYKLAELLKISPEGLLDKIEQNKDANRLIVRNDVPTEIVLLLEERKREFPNMVIEVQPVRFYNNLDVAAHILGYVGDISEGEYERLKVDPLYQKYSIVGKAGLESFFDKMVRGRDGYEQVEVNVSGRIVDRLGRIEPIPGNGLALTIDLDLQRAAEKAVDEQLLYLRNTGLAPNAYAASVVVLNPNTGEVLAMVSRPNFNPNFFVQGISYKNWNEINNNPNDPLTNKAISGEYPPGSSFKIVTATAALSTGKVTPSEMYYDPGHHPLVPSMGNDGGKALGYLNLREAMAKSDNVYFYEMGYRAGIDELAKFSRQFGMGAVTGISLFGESEGQVANPDYKLRIFDEDWYLGDTMNASIGQGYQLATPIQLANLMACIANGGTRYKPYLVKNIFNEKDGVIKETQPEVLGKIDVSQENIEAIKLGVRGVAESGGTGAQLADFPLPLAGKTGTAENPHGKDHGVFVGYGPFNNPQIVVAVVVEQGDYASISAVPIARKVFAAAFGVKE